MAQIEAKTPDQNGGLHIISEDTVDIEKTITGKEEICKIWQCPGKGIHGGIR